MASTAVIGRGPSLATRRDESGDQPIGTGDLASTRDGRHLGHSWGGVAHHGSQVAWARRVQPMQRGAHHAALRPATATSRRHRRARQPGAECLRSTDDRRHSDGHHPGLPPPAGRTFERGDDQGSRRFDARRDQPDLDPPGRHALRPARTSETIRLRRALDERVDGMLPRSWFQRLAARLLARWASRRSTNTRSTRVDTCWPNSIWRFPTCASASSVRAGSGMLRLTHSGATALAGGGSDVSVGRSSTCGGAISIGSMTWSTLF